LAKIQETQTTKARQEKDKLQQKGLIQAKERDYTVKFEFEDPGKLNAPILQIKDVSFSWSPDQKPLFQNIELNIDMDSRIAIVGPNGAGKSTFMSLMLDENGLEPTTGEIVRNRHLRATKFAQHFVEQLEMSASPVDYLQKCFPDMTPLEIRGVLGRFGLKGTTQTQAIALLSGGQKSRLMLTNIALRKPHILFLDEPTNHLDIESVDALAKALEDFPGGIVLISHDERLITSVCNELWVVADGTVEVFDGEFEDYKQGIIDLMDDSLFEESDDESTAAQTSSHPHASSSSSTSSSTQAAKRGKQGKGKK
jgi:ATPase subunit of ABC transporter with duplicated ATPase domains